MLILQVLSDGEHANPIRVHYLIREEHEEKIDHHLGKEMWSTDYVTQRMSDLRGDLELLDRVPPEGSGLYKISDLGHVALRHSLDNLDGEISIRELLELTERLDDRGPVPPDAIPWDKLAARS